MCKGFSKNHGRVQRARSNHVGLGVGAATLQVLYLVKNPVDVWSLLRIRHHYGAQKHLQALWVTEGEVKYTTSEYKEGACNNLWDFPLVRGLSILHRKEQPEHTSIFRNGVSIKELTALSFFFFFFKMLISQFLIHHRLLLLKVHITIHIWLLYLLISKEALVCCDVDLISAINVMYCHTLKHLFRKCKKNDFASHTQKKQRVICTSSYTMAHITGWKLTCMTVE